MSLRKIICLLLTLCFVFSFAGCGQTSPTIDDEDQFFADETSSAEPEEEGIINPLTGIKGLSEERENRRPVAVMINNYSPRGSISIAQRVQTGLGKADLVFETEVEGGITRLMAVFADPTVVSTLGTIRSARVAYSDIANGLGAFYVHHGMDDNYCKPHMSDLGIIHGNIPIDKNNTYTERKANGEAIEHTLYTTGEKLLSYMQKLGYDTEVTVKPFANFADEKTSISFAENTCTFARVPFSTSFETDFTYNAETGKYVRGKNKTAFKDYFTGETEEFKNVFVLKANMSNYPIAKYRKVDLSGGEGYYISGGTYTEIRWTKGNSSDSFKFTKADGTTLTVNAGNSYICITNKDNNITIE